ncbi:MAG: PD-(D/E)XK nuclease family protein [bacterium]|nr:PD-(D/E)XK nuclease family protein [bacterium]
MDLPKPYISYSQIRLYQTCPKMYYYTYVKKIKTPINDKIFLGIVAHSVFEYFLTEKIKGTEPKRDVLLDLFKEKFNEKNNNISWTIPEDETLKRGLAFVRHFLKFIAPEIKPMMVEKEMEVFLPDLDVKLKGIVDLVETDFSITDFKTTTAKWAKTRIQSSYLQMQIYRYLFEQTFGNVISHLRFRIVFSKNAVNIKDQKISVKATDLDPGKMFDIIKYVVDNIRNEVFYKNESYTCGFCSYKDICRKEDEK